MQRYALGCSQLVWSLSERAVRTPAGATTLAFEHHVGATTWTRYGRLNLQHNMSIFGRRTKRVKRMLKQRRTLLCVAGRGGTSVLFVCASFFHRSPLMLTCIVVVVVIGRFVVLFAPPLSMSFIVNCVTVIRRFLPSVAFISRSIS